MVKLYICLKTSAVCSGITIPKPPFFFGKRKVKMKRIPKKSIFTGTKQKIICKTHHYHTTPLAKFLNICNSKQKK